ncbi:MAG: GGDEF domain-containing protein, partial [Candidatus Competibacterales bacterium]|nr:GGDEF domain-containing protein [Candidatus Competibacterales bacterium]
LSDGMLQLESGRDPLTNLFNRRFLSIVLQREVELSLSKGIRFAILLVDIDHFKKVNDTHGHDAGDTVLEQIGDMLATVVRAGDFVFRYGGEEFLVVLTDVNAEQALKVAEKIRNRIHNHAFLLSQDKRLRLSASIGVAVHDGHPDYTRAISQADRALIEAKHSGCNHCILADPSGGGART